jgi:hypothetical protein
MIEQKLLDQGALTEAEAADLLKAMVDQRLSGEFSKQNLMDKLYEAKLQEIKKNETVAKDRIRDLNAQKQVLMDKEMKVLEEKGKHEHIVQRGLDFLVEMEMNQGPDLEDIKKNIEVDPKLYSMKWLNREVQDQRTDSCDSQEPFRTWGQKS